MHRLVAQTIKGGCSQCCRSAAARTTAGVLGLSDTKQRMTVTLEAILLLLVGYSSLTDGAICNADLDPLPFDCQEAYVLGCRRSGVYTIDPGCGNPFSVWCDMNNGGGWTMFQRRRDGSENFYRGWTEYENGFGNVKGEHWLGLKKISCLTSVGVKNKLRIDLADFAGHSKYACYDYFHVGTPSTNYRLTVGGYQNWGMGIAGDSLIRGHSHNGMPFTTHDRDNDKSSGNCAVSWQGAWWYDNCHDSNLNGLYLDGQSNSRGVVWYYFNATAPSSHTLRYSDMKLRRSD